MIITKEIARETWDKHLRFVRLSTIYHGSSLAIPFINEEPNPAFNPNIPIEWDKMVAYKINYQFEYCYFVSVDDDRGFETHYTWFNVLWHGEIVAMVWR